MQEAYSLLQGYKDRPSPSVCAGQCGFVQAEPEGAERGATWPATQEPAPVGGSSPRPTIPVARPKQPEVNLDSPVDAIRGQPGL